MKAIKTEPMVKYSNQVHTTNDYFLFKSIDGNRDKNILHLNRLKQSIKENYLFTVIIVNENYEIIDGQHRFEIIKELKLPLNYIICDGYGLNEVHILNANSKTWGVNDYMEGYCNLGYSEYIKFKEFKDKYGFSNKDSLLLLSNQDSGNTIKQFYAGKFKVTNYNRAIEYADKLKMIGKFFDRYNSTSFIRVMKQMFENEKFVFIDFLSKLKLQPYALKDCNNMEQYKRVIEEIYNYKRRDKVNLRF